MAFPNPIEAPNSFLDHLKAANLDFGTTVFAHYQSRPGPSSNGRLDDIPATEWCERMDTLLVSNVVVIDTHQLTTPYL
jgi:hypothetical protein